jgi:hypothetical protein
MNPIALRLSAMSLELEGCGMPEIVEALQIAEREIVRLDERQVTAAMVDRFLSWPLPKSVCSDTCCSDSKYQFPRFGTSLLAADEARAMLEHVLRSAQQHGGDRGQV